MEGTQCLAGVLFQFFFANTVGFHSFLFLFYENGNVMTKVKKYLVCLSFKLELIK